MKLYTLTFIVERYSPSEREGEEEVYEYSAEGASLLGTCWSQPGGARLLGGRWLSHIHGRH